MYKHSKARLKIIHKLSESFDILCGTEQGHLVSPELFKMYIHKLSMELNEIAQNLENPVNVPELNGTPISHILWADDIVLLARDKKVSKTAIMIFNKSGRQLKESYQFECGAKTIPSTKSYTYLGIVFTLSGSQQRTQQILRQKGMKKYINTKNVPKSATFKLFDSLWLPMAVKYGSLRLKYAKPYLKETIPIRKWQTAPQTH